MTVWWLGGLLYILGLSKGLDTGLHYIGGLSYWLFCIIQFLECVYRVFRLVPWPSTGVLYEQGGIQGGVPGGRVSGGAAGAAPQGGHQGADPTLQGVQAHGHQGHAHQDVDGGEEDGEHVLLPGLGVQGEPGDPDGGEQGEAVVEGVHRVHGVVGGDPGRAEAQVEEQDGEEEPGGSGCGARGSRDFPVGVGVRGALGVPALPAVPRGSGLVAAAPRVGCLQVVSHGAPDQADVEEKDGQSNAGDANGDELAQGGGGDASLVACKRT